MKIVSPLYIILLLVSCRFINRTADELPSFDLLLPDSLTHFNTKSIPEGRPIALLYFSPDCEHCQKETEGILKHMDSLKQVRFYFVTNDPSERLWVYNQMYKLYNYPNITLGRDFKYFFPGHFKDASPPYLVIYDENKRERFIYKGEIEASKIISFINAL